MGSAVEVLPVPVVRQGPQVRSRIRRRHLTNFGVPKIHDGKAIELPTLTDNAEVEHNAVEITARRGVVP